MKRILPAVLIATVLFHFIAPRKATAQLEPFGLEGKMVTSPSLSPQRLYPWQSFICAGTDSSGIYLLPGPMGRGPLGRRAAANKRPDVGGLRARLVPRWPPHRLRYPGGGRDFAHSRGDGVELSAFEAREYC